MVTTTNRARATMPDMLNEIGPGHVLGGGGALALAAGFLYRIYRTIKSDRREDAKADRVDEFSEQLLKRVQELELRVDSMAKERNEALQAAARMTVEIDYLKAKVEELERINEVLKESHMRAKARGGEGVV